MLNLWCFFIARCIFSRVHCKHSIWEIWTNKHPTRKIAFRDKRMPRQRWQITFDETWVMRYRFTHVLLSIECLPPVRINFQGCYCSWRAFPPPIAHQGIVFPENGRKIQLLKHEKQCALKIVNLCQEDDCFLVKQGSAHLSHDGHTQNGIQFIIVAFKLFTFHNEIVNGCSRTKNCILYLVWSESHCWDLMLQTIWKVDIKTQLIFD